MYKSALSTGFLFLFIFFFTSGFGQSREIDSLKRLLPQTENAERVRVYIGISYNFLRISADSSLAYSNRAYAYAQQTNNRRGIAQALLMQGNALNMQGNNYKAKEKHLQAPDIFTELNDTSAIGIISNDLGIDYQDLGLYAKAIEQYKKSFDIADKLNNDEDIYLATNNIGSVYEEWGKFDLAREYYQNALKIAEENNNQRYMGISLQNIGVAYQHLGAYDQALRFFERSLKVSQEIGDKKGIFNTYLNKGVVYSKMEDNEEAIQNYEKALEISIESGNKKNIAEASLKLGSLLTMQKKYIQAYPLLNNALNIAQETNEPILIKDAFQAIANFYKNRKDFEQALLNYESYTNLKDSIFNQDSRKEISEMQTLYEVDKKEKEIEIQNLKIEQQQAQFYYIVFGVGLLILLTLLLFSRYRLKQKHMRLMLERKNIDIEQRLLRTQMNPHFIFNSLNSISSFISLNNPDNAQAYLSKFARLMRYILENSRKTMIPLEDEINTLSLNLELEQLRHNHRFDYQIKVDDQLEIENTFVPPMLIQPFIENAIFHGLSGIEEQGMIKIEFQANGELMYCTVEDNGVGRDLTLKNKQKTGTKEHVSLGMQVTRERLAILNEKTKEEVSLRIVDLKSDDGIALGTKIELHIPYETE